MGFAVVLFVSVVFFLVAVLFFIVPVLGVEGFLDDIVPGFAPIDTRNFVFHDNRYSQKWREGCGSNHAKRFRRAPLTTIDAQLAEAPEESALAVHFDVRER